MSNSAAKKSIALFGRSGAGKSIVANHLVTQHGFQLCSTGSLCRAISQILFGNEERNNLNALSKKIREIDPTLWMQAALLGAKKTNVVFDSIRYEEDASYLRERGFLIWQVSCPMEICVERLNARGQSFAKGDMLHAMEESLQAYKFDATINNGSRSFELVLADVERALLT